MNGIFDSPEFEQWSSDLGKAMKDAENAPKLDCPCCGNRMATIIGLGRVSGYCCRGMIDCTGVEYTIEDLCDAERYRIITEDALRRKQNFEDMRTRNGYTADPTPEQRKTLKFCGTCSGYHLPTAEHPACPGCLGYLHSPSPPDLHFDFKGWRFRAPFHCMCCGKEVCFRQWAFGRSCGACDTGICMRDNLHPRSHKVFCGPNTELIDPTEAEKFNFTPERMAKIPPDEPLHWRDRKLKLPDYTV